MCGFQNSNIDICKNKPQKYATKIPTTKQKGIHTLHQFIVSKPNTAHATKFFLRLLFRSSHFSFLVFGHFWQRSYENTKILCNLCLHFARQDGQDGKKRKENHATKVTKIPKTKRRKYGMNET